MRKLSDLFISEDRRRKRVRLTGLSWVAGSVVLVLAVALIALGVKGMWASVPMQPLATPVATARATLVTQTPTASDDCPDDPAEWGLRPYTLPGSDRTLYAIEPTCVMEQVEQAFWGYLEARREHGRRWTRQLDARFRSPAGFTAPLSGETVHELTGPPTLSCTESVKSDGAPAEHERAVAFYTVSQDGPSTGGSAGSPHRSGHRSVADVLLVSKPDGPYLVRKYDCETGELIEESEEDGTQALVVYWPMVYEEGRWRTGHRYDVYRYVPAARIEPSGMVEVVLEAQARLQ